MKARSLVFDLFGDYLCTGGGEVRLRGLIALMGCFGVPEATVRVVVTRLRKEGWLASRRDGRETTYLLTDAAGHMLEEGQERVFRRSEQAWDGRWHLVIYSVPETERAVREQLRKKLSWLGYGPLSPSVWLSPHDRVDEVKLAVAQWSSVRMDLFSAASEGPQVDRAMAARSWDLDELNRDYAELVAEFEPRLEHYSSGDLAGQDALVERTRLVGRYRESLYRDPELPVQLLPEDWAGWTAHKVFRQAHELLREPAEECVASLLSRTA
ncbi:PaaX family transcriptional regulator C-terminal domain-containing protein [Pseudonocardia eucalypti]